MTTEIEEFLQQEHILSLATSVNNIPYICSVFYIYMNIKNDPSLLFASHSTTRHAQEMQKNPHVAANIFLKTKQINDICGVQSTGRVTLLNGSHAHERNAYLKAFPYAKALEPFPLWKINIEYAKLTDNREQFANHKTWNK